jgi:hypothetical protein
MGDGMEEGESHTQSTHTQCPQQGGSSYASPQPVDDDHDIFMEGAPMEGYPSTLLLFCSSPHFPATIW